MIALLSSMNFPSKENIFLLHYPFDLFSRLKPLGKKSMLLKQYENMISVH